MNRFCLWGLLLALFGLPAAATDLQRITVDDRSVLLYEPSAPVADVLPLIVALHGGGGSAAGLARHLDLQRQVDQSQYRVVFLEATRHQRPDGKTARYWNDGACCQVGLRPAVDDVGHVARVIGTLQDQGLVGTGQVALVGYSNGAKMAYRVACDRGDLVAVLVAISGARDSADCTGLPGLRVLNIHGDRDRRVPLDGGVSRRAPGIRHDPVMAIGRDMQDAGARFQLQIVPGAGHRLEALDAGLQTSTGIDLVETVLAFILSH